MVSVLCSGHQSIKDQNGALHQVQSQQYSHIDSSFPDRTHIEKYLLAQHSESSELKKPPHTLIHTYKPLIVCRDGGTASQTGTEPTSITVSYRVVFSVGLVLTKLGFYPQILTGGFASYRTIVSDYLENCSDFKR